MAGDFRPPSSPPPSWSSQAQPSPLTADEESSAAAAAIARRFNPAMAFTAPDIWPVDVRYAWRDGADLMAETLDQDGRVVDRRVAVKNADLERRSWADLPSRDGAGRRVRYVVDAPGDDRDDRGLSRWRRRFGELVLGRRHGQQTPEQSPQASEFPPTQYAHLFWYNREQGLLGIQYWFFYPYNEWVNRHEGDWEHVNVILKGPSRLEDATAFSPHGYQFYFHGFRHDTDQVVRVGGDQPGEDHVVVFTGGKGKLLFWRGHQSGASYPLPALFPSAGSGPWKPDEDTRAPARFVAAHEFNVVLLPEPARLDAHARPELSWLKLDFFVGQEQMHTNPPLLDWLGMARPTVQPARRAAWNEMKPKPLWGRRATQPDHAAALPLGWPIIATPWARMGSPLASQ